MPAEAGLHSPSMPGPLKTEAVVLRSIRYGEADRILHVYTPHRGRVSAIAKGVRRARSRFGGRLEPFFRLRLELHEGRGELLTVTGAHTIDGHPRLREDAGALDAAARACDAVGRLFETSEPHPGVFNLLCRQLALLDARAGAAARGWDARGGYGSGAAIARGPTDRRSASTRHARGRAAVPPEAAARRGPRPPPGGVCALRGARAPRRASRAPRAGSCAAPARQGRSRWGRMPTAS